MFTREIIRLKSALSAARARQNSRRWNSRGEESSMKVLAIYGSPRREGNTALLLRELVKGLRTQGGNATEIFLCDLQILPCVADHSCSQSGECFLQDDMQSLYNHLTAHDCIVLAAPIFFYNVNAQTKALIDRSQSLWARKYVLKQPVN